MQPSSDDLDLANAFFLVHREVDVISGNLARKFSLTSQQTQLICTLSHRPSLGEMAALLGCDKTNMTGMVDRLERRGLLTREADPRDRRVSRIVLTKEGEALRTDLSAEFTKAVAERCAALTRDDRAHLARLIQATLIP
ncbi:MarR family winged helix-turn-helix transcriptional regulator [Streptomyces sp. NPDC059479]|uniref:MarR family winged helix-turn-helix transcriptional regulator n=1 Tax=Streptomyces sp. NPDC059479 TaxID=3346848 RepID=UPI003693DF55